LRSRQTNPPCRPFGLIPSQVLTLILDDLFLLCGVRVAGISVPGFSDGSCFRRKPFIQPPERLEYLLRLPAQSPEVAYCPLIFVPLFFGGKVSTQLLTLVLEPFPAPRFLILEVVLPLPSSRVSPYYFRYPCDGILFSTESLRDLPLFLADPSSFLMTDPFEPKHITRDLAFCTTDCLIGLPRLGEVVLPAL